MVYIVAEIVTKHIKQQLICNLGQKNQGMNGFFQRIYHDKQAVTLRHNSEQ